MTTANKLQRILDTKDDLKAEIDEFLDEVEGFPMPIGLPFKDYASWLAYARGGDAPRTAVSVLFVNGEDGAWPEDLAEVFTDTAGTVPANITQSIARVNALGRDTIQSNAALRPKLGAAPVEVRNLLNDSDNLYAYTTLNSPIVTANAAQNPFGTANDATLFEVNAGQTEFSIRSIGLIEIGQSRTGSIYFKPVSVANNARLGFGNAERTTQASVAFPDLVPNTAQTQGLADLSVAAQPVGNEGWFRLSSAQTRTALTTSEVRVRLSSAQAGDQILLWRAQHERGLAMTAPQKVASSLDITEQGFPSPRFIRFDLSDDVLPTNFPNGFTGDVMVFGRKGSWIERDVAIAAGGDLNIGPQTFTGAPAGVLNALGDIVGWTAVERSLDEDEIARAVAYHRQKGAKGLLAEGPELVANGDFSDGATGWALGAGWTISGGVATFNGTQNVSILEQQLLLSINEFYLFRFNHIVNLGSFLWGFNFGTAPFRNVVGTASASGVIRKTDSRETAIRIASENNGNIKEFTIDNVSVRRLIPQEELA